MAMIRNIRLVLLKALTPFTLCTGISWLLACSSTDEAPGGGRVEHPVEPGPKALSAASVASPASTSATPLPSSLGSSSPSALATELPVEPTMSPLDKAILEDCPERVWSKNVPKRGCTKDEQCGDGFCDRGHCAPIWTCTGAYGKRCEEDARCGTSFLCINGRCSSCVSDAECKSYPNNQNPKCVPEPTMPGVQICHGITPRAMGSSAPWTPPPPSK